VALPSWPSYAPPTRPDYLLAAATAIIVSRSSVTSRSDACGELWSIRPKPGIRGLADAYVGHGIGVAAAFVSLGLCGALHAPSAMIGNHVTLARIVASMLAVGLTIGGQIPVRASHAPATATTLLITLGGFPADLVTIGVIVVGVGISTLLCDWGRRLVTGQFAFQRRKTETL